MAKSAIGASRRGDPRRRGVLACSHRSGDRDRDRRAADCQQRPSAVSVRGNLAPEWYGRHLQVNGPLVRKNTRVSWCGPVLTRSTSIGPERPSAVANVNDWPAVGQGIPSLRMNEPLYRSGTLREPAGSNVSNATLARLSSSPLILPIASDIGGARYLRGKTQCDSYCTRSVAN